MALKIRIALPKDQKQLLRMAYKAHQESPRYRKFLFKKEAAAQLIDKLISTTRTNGEQIAIVCEDTEKRTLTGVFVLALQSHLWCSGTYVIDFVQYIKPKYRGGTSFLRLIDAAEKWAMSKNADEIMFGVSSGYKAEKNVKLYERLGYKGAVHSATKRFTL